MQRTEKKIKDLTRLAVQAKKSGQKDKALRLLTQIKTQRANNVKLQNYNIMITKQVSNFDAIGIDQDMADIFKDSNQVLENLQDQTEENMDVF